MRNLKKILAMALALVMSLSLMATAGAADFTDASSINEKYETAIEVLEGLGVFKGYQDGTFQPQGSITRAETAAIIYRIVTGDVKDEQVGIYADYNLFTDVPSTSWFAGYVNYCANAEYIKGVGGGKFNPNAQVTGYAALAMILRAIGYTANGGFTGSDWEVQTARTAESRKITKNIMTGTLGQNANRETVAEILFQAILVNMVDHNILNTNNGNQGYTEIDETLGYKTFKLEEVEGVVVANEFANLYGTSILSEGKTDLEDYDGTVRSLNTTTELTDVGESRIFYTADVSKVLAMTDTGTNKVFETGAAITADKAISEVGSAKTGDTEYYVNFDRDGNYTCDQRLEFNVVFDNADAETAFDNYAGVDISAIAALDNLDRLNNGTLNTNNDWSVQVGTWNNGNLSYGAPLTLGANQDDFNQIAAYTNALASNTQVVRFSKIIPAGRDISSTDLRIINGIFGIADNMANNGWTKDQITGDVFIGTKSTNNEVTDEERDLSNTISYNKFFEDYINADVYDINWDKSGNGEWVKTVDYNGDGIVDYVFLTEYWLDEAVSTYTNKDDETVLVYYTLSETSNAYSVRYLEDVTVGDVVIYSMIDGQALVELAEHEDKTVQSYSWKEDEITTTSGDTYGQSAINNNTDMQELIQNMDNTVEYTLYFDKYGYVRAYKLPGGTQYALVTEVYAANNNNGNLVQNWPLTVELTYPDADNNVVTEEYNLVGGSGSDLFNDTVFTEVGSVRGNYAYYNYLQPAIAHLGVSRLNYAPDVTDDADFGATWSFWDKDYQIVKSIDTMDGNEFNYGAYQWGANPASQTSTKTTSFTNVGVVNINGENATVEGAAQLKLNRDGTVATYKGGVRPIYARDYVQLSTDAVTKGAVRYAIDDANDGSSTYEENNNYYVNAVNDTQFYIKYNNGVYYFKGYANMPALNADTVGRIHAAYAVARDTSADNSEKPYWVADVIVYEVEDFVNNTVGSISLAYYTPDRVTDSVQEVDTINGANGLVKLTPPRRAWSADRGQWGKTWESYGFYRLYNETAPEDGVMTAGSIAKITNYANGYDNARTGWNFAKNGIYAGTIVREVRLAQDGLYIDINTNGLYESDGTTLQTNVSLKLNDNIYSITKDTKWNGYNIVRNVATKLYYSNYSDSNVKAGDRVIWLGGDLGGTATSNSNFIVDIGNQTTNNALWASTADFLAKYPANPTNDPNPVSTSLWWEVYEESSRNTNLDTYSITAKVVDATGADMTGATVTIDPTTALISSAASGIELTTITLGGTATGMDITNVTVTNNTDKGAGKNATAIKGANGNWVLFNVQGNVELAITAEPATYELSIASLPTGTPAITNVSLAAIGTSGETGYVPADATWTGTAVNPARGAAYSITLNSPVAGWTYNVTGGNAVINHTTNMITGTMTEDTALTITAVQETVTVGLSEDTEHVAFAMTGGASGTTANVGTATTALTITLTPDAGYTLTAAGIEVTIGGTTLAPAAINYNTGTSVLTLPTYTLQAGDNIVIKATPAVARFSITLSATPADVDALTGLTTDPAIAASGDPTTVAYGASITVRESVAAEMASVYYTMGGGAKTKVNFDPLTMEATISNITGDIVFFDNNT